MTDAEVEEWETLPRWFKLVLARPSGVKGVRMVRCSWRTLTATVAFVEDCIAPVEVIKSAIVFGRRWT